MSGRHNEKRGQGKFNGQKDIEVKRSRVNLINEFGLMKVRTKM